MKCRTELTQQSTYSESNFLFYFGIAKVVVISLSLFCLFCKKCKYGKGGWMMTVVEKFAYTKQLPVKGMSYFITKV